MKKCPHIEPKVETLNAAIMLAEANGFTGLKEALVSMLPTREQAPAVFLACPFCDRELQVEDNACCGEVGHGELKEKVCE